MECRLNVERQLCEPNERAVLTPSMDVGTLHPNGVDILHAMTESRALSRIELLQGTLDLIILQTLRWGPRHGYGIAQLIRASSDEALHVDTGSLYPALHRLERQKWIAADRPTADRKQRCAVYRLAPALSVARRTRLALVRAAPGAQSRRREGGKARWVGAGRPRAAGALASTARGRVGGRPFPPAQPGVGWAAGPGLPPVSRVSAPR